jgi:hypothetical protein
MILKHYNQLVIKLLLYLYSYVNFVKKNKELFLLKNYYVLINYKKIGKIFLSKV